VFPYRVVSVLVDSTCNVVVLKKMEEILVVKLDAHLGELVESLQHIGRYFEKNCPRTCYTIFFQW